MRIRRDTIFISSVVFTIALLCLVPAFVQHVLDGRDAVHENDFGIRLYLRESASLGIASLAVVLIGLIVIWAGYIKKIRWAWFVMFVIVWGWAFPIMAFPDFVYPLYRGALKITSLSGVIRAAFGEPGVMRDIVHEVMIFALMVIALILPMKTFFWGGKSKTINRTG
jgi:hypothetical protein